MHLAKFQLYLLYINFWSADLSVGYSLIVFAFPRWYCLCNYHNTNNNFLRATFNWFCNKHFLAHLKLFNKSHYLLDHKTGWEMTCRLIRWPLLEPVITPDEIICLINAARVIVKGSLVSTMSLSSCPLLWFSCILPVLACGSSSDNNLTYAGYTVHCQKKCSYRSRLGDGRC